MTILQKLNQINRAPVSKYYCTKCDFCETKYYHVAKKTNRRKNGYPVYLLCKYCHDWSIGKKNQKYAKVMEGEISEPKTSGKIFTKLWCNGVIKRI